MTAGRIAGVRFGHASIVAADWRRLATFYADLLGCELVPPERDYEGSDLARGTGVPDAALQGAHLRLPGHGTGGPTLEIYTYRRAEARLPSAANRWDSPTLPSPSTTWRAPAKRSWAPGAGRWAKW